AIISQMPGSARSRDAWRTSAPWPYWDADTPSVGTSTNRRSFAPRPPSDRAKPCTSRCTKANWIVRWREPRGSGHGTSDPGRGTRRDPQRTRRGEAGAVRPGTLGRGRARSIAVTSTPDVGAWLDTRRREVDEALARCLPSPPACPDRVAEAMRYSLFAGGKR